MDEVTLGDLDLDFLASAAFFTLADFFLSLGGFVLALEVFFDFCFTDFDLALLALDVFLDVGFTDFADFADFAFPFVSIVINFVIVLTCANN